jgi:hypothetical protein
MSVRQPHYSTEEFARRDDEIYESQVRVQVEEGNHGKIMAISLQIDGFKVFLIGISNTNKIFTKTT